MVTGIGNLKNVLSQIWSHDRRAWPLGATARIGGHPIPNYARSPCLSRTPWNS